jgi:hypothetical protein
MTKKTCRLIRRFQDKVNSPMSFRRAKRLWRSQTPSQRAQARKEMRERLWDDAKAWAKGNEVRPV